MKILTEKKAFELLKIGAASLEDCSNKLRDTKVIVSFAIDKLGIHQFKFASIRLREDVEYIANKCNWSNYKQIIKYITNDFKDNEDSVMALLKLLYKEKSEEVFYYFINNLPSQRVKESKSFIKKIFKNFSYLTEKYIMPESCVNDPEFAKELVEISPRASRYFSPKIIDNDKDYYNLIEKALDKINGNNIEQ